jgi:hypothetical protein
MTVRATICIGFALAALAFAGPAEARHHHHHRCGIGQMCLMPPGNTIKPIIYDGTERVGLRRPPGKGMPVPLKPVSSQ